MSILHPSSLLTVYCSLFTAFSAFAYEPDIILDAHSDPSAVQLEPSAAWADDTTTADAFRANAKVVNSTTVNTGEYARFHTTLPVTGPWQVFVWNNGRSGFGDLVNVKVTHADTAPSIATLNQSSSGGQWFLAGTFWFDTTKEAEVRIEHNDSGKLSADAVRFSLAEAAVMVDSSNPPVGAMTYVPGVSSWATGVDKSGNEQTVRRSNVANATATFAPVLPAPGDYDVSIWLPQKSGAWVPSGGTPATSFDVEVFHRSGSTVVSVSIPAGNTNEGGWLHIENPATVSGAPAGTFRFDATPTSGANPNKIVFRSAGVSPANAYVPADTVRFAKAGSFGIYMDDDDGAGPPGVVFSPSADWTSLWESSRTAQRWVYFRNIPYGPRVMRAGANSSSRTATYTPALPELGLYDVYLWYPYQTTNSHLNQITVHTALGDVIPPLVDQEQNAGMWAHVGRHILYAGDDPDTAKRPWLRLATGNEPSGNYTFADAVLFLRDNEEVDTDGDALPDWHETVLGTSSSTNDLNNDGRADGWDTDGDNLSDYEEWLLGTNALVANSQVTSSPSLQIQIPLQ